MSMMDSTGLVMRLNTAGYVLAEPMEAISALKLPRSDLLALSSSWAHLPRDTYLRDGGRYRFRRHSCFVQELPNGSPQVVAHRAHWQPSSYNALHGGIERWFEPIEPPVLANAAWPALIGALGTLFATVRTVPRWYIEAHQFRIDTAEGIGRPTPEGAHRDGVDFVAVILVHRGAIRGGETRVFEAQGNAGVRFTMQEPWTMLLMDDARVIHETTPIQPLADASAAGVRDTLVLTYRAQDFQAPT